MLYNRSASRDRSCRKASSRQSRAVSVSPSFQEQCACATQAFAFRGSSFTCTFKQGTDGLLGMIETAPPPGSSQQYTGNALLAQERHAQLRWAHSPDPSSSRATTTQLLHARGGHLCIGGPFRDEKCQNTTQFTSSIAFTCLIATHTCRQFFESTQDGFLPTSHLLLHPPQQGIPQSKEYPYGERITCIIGESCATLACTHNFQLGPQVKPKVLQFNQLVQLPTQVLQTEHGEKETIETSAAGGGGCERRPQHSQVTHIHIFLAGAFTYPLTIHTPKLVSCGINKIHSQSATIIPVEWSLVTLFFQDARRRQAVGLSVHVPKQQTPVELGQLAAPV